MTDLQADYVVVGAGSAGCVLADRLSEDGARVVLLEAGPSDWHPMIHVPAGALHLRANPLVNWNTSWREACGWCARSGVCCDRPWCADLWRHHCDGVLP